MTNPQNKTSFFSVKNEADVAELYFYSAIGESFWSETTSAKDVLAELKKIPSSKPLNIYINSPGGSVFDGNAIYSQLKRRKGKIT